MIGHEKANFTRIQEFPILPFLSYLQIEHVWKNEICIILLMLLFRICS